MLTSIRQVNEEFFKLFFNTKIISKGVEKQVNFRYAKKSSYDYTEEQDNQIYPCIAVQDYAPNIEEGYVDYNTYSGAEDLDKLKGYIFTRPIHLEFRYDVSIAAKSYNDFLALQDHFNKEYVCNTGFIFNAKFEGEDYVGDVVQSSVRATDIPRTDGVMETNYEFTVKAWVHVIEAKEVELVQKIILKAKQTDLQGNFGSVK